MTDRERETKREKETERKRHTQKEIERERIGSERRKNIYLWVYGIRHIA